MSLTSCKSDSPQEALEKFEEALRNKIYSDTYYLDSTEQEKEYQKAKAEMLTWLSHIP